MGWEVKLKRLFGNATVDKGLMQRFNSFRLPRFVSEYIVQMFIDEHGIELGAQQIEEFLNKYYPKTDSVDYLHYMIQTHGEISLIDNFKVNVNIEQHGNGHRLCIPLLNTSKAQVQSEDVIADNPRLLGSGLWGMGKIVKAGNNSVTLSKFKPFQVAAIDLDKFKEIRAEFSTEEWLSVLISSMGFSPEAFADMKKRLILLSRLLPLVQKSIFLFEFGRPGTGKTYVFDQLSSASFVISGSKITPAKLFRDCTTKQNGLLKQYDAILFDEIDKIEDNDLDDEVINRLLRYMESNSYDRCGVEIISDASLMFSGNLPRSFRDRGVPRFLEPLAKQLKSEAFLDRFSGVVPGWEINPLSNNCFSSFYGFSADYFSSILQKLKHEDWEARIKTMLQFSSDTNRDVKAVVKSASGLLKLIYPHGRYDDNLQAVIDYALEMRQYIIDEKFELHQNINDDRRLQVQIVG